MLFMPRKYLGSLDVSKTYLSSIFLNIFNCLKLIQKILFIEIYLNQTKYFFKFKFINYHSRLHSPFSTEY